MNTALNSYQNTMADKITSARPEELMIMLYDGMILRIKQAKERFTSGQVASAQEAIVRSMQIADALMENINFKDGGETAQNLERLYCYIIKELASANRNENPDSYLDNALRIIEPLYEGWKGLAAKTLGNSFDAVGAL